MEKRDKEKRAMEKVGQGDFGQIKTGICNLCLGIMGMAKEYDFCAGKKIKDNLTKAS